VGSREGNRTSPSHGRGLEGKYCDREMALPIDSIVYMCRTRRTESIARGDCSVVKDVGTE
jgi:hypothetical protein